MHLNHLDELINWRAGWNLLPAGEWSNCIWDERCWGVQLSRCLLHVTVGPQASQGSRAFSLLPYSCVRSWWRRELNSFPHPQLCSPCSNLRRFISYSSSPPAPISPLSKEPSQQQVKKWGFSLEETLKDPAGQELFLKFLESEFSSENLRWAKIVWTFFALLFNFNSYLQLRSNVWKVIMQLCSSTLIVN